MRAARVSTALVTGCLAALVLAPAALAAPALTPGTTPPPARTTPPPARRASSAARAAATGTAASHAVATTSAAAAATTSASSGSSTTTGPSAGAPAPASSAPPCSTDPTADHPVICLPQGSGEDRVGFVPAGDSIEFGAQIVNGGAVASDARIVIALPATLRVFSDDPPVRIDDWFPLDSSDGEGTDLRCTQSPDFRTVVCDTGTLAPGANILVGIPLYAPDNAPNGQRATFTVTLQPSGTSTFTPSSVGATVQFLGASHVRTTLDPTALQVVVGTSGTVVASLHNLGPSAAIGTVGLAVVSPISGSTPHFLITNSPIDVTADPTADDRTAGAGAGITAVRAQLARHLLSAQWSARSVRTASDNHPSPIGFWPIGTIAAGDTAHVPVVVKAVHAGSDELTFGALSLTDPGTCNADGSVCDEIASARLTAVAATAPDSGRQQPLAATGTRADTTFLQVAVLLIALGALLVRLGRPVRARHRR